jgi:hypothetical protein
MDREQQPLISGPGFLRNPTRTLIPLTFKGAAMSEQEQTPPHGDIATIHGWPVVHDGVSIDLKWMESKRTALEPLLWVDTRTLPAESRQEFWCEWHLGAPVWVRFRLVRQLFNRSVFQAVEVRLATASEQRPQGTWWPL